MNMGRIISDFVFVAMILACLSIVIMFLWNAVRIGYKKAMIEQLQNRTNKNPHTMEVVELEPFPQPEPGRKPHIGMYKVHLLAPQTAQYGKENAVYIPTVAGLPASAIPNVSMKAPWSISQVEAAEVPEVEGCRRTATGLFHECSVPPANESCIRF